ncbi:DUF402 domain-containing protein [Actinoalloteichus spitiensis]|uniref:DUF402 domain-containing protein n=1 Tax=Actinoalloteichus spitiensis TaxID=252394 RepID=UPI000371278C|nr:DUF402 domain-containing protein [Actinoalloteichus spitiensis]
MSRGRPGASTPRWGAGAEILFRFLRPDGTVGAVHPARVVSDDGAAVFCWVLGGTEIVATRLPDGRLVREAPLEQRFVLGRRPCRSRWTGSSTLRWVPEGQWSSVWWFFGPAGDFRGWYVNLEIPRGRTPFGVDRVDGVLDVFVRPDRTWEWKDEDELVAALAAGRVTREQAGLLRAEGERVIALAEAGAFPFDGSHLDPPDPAWPRPELPAWTCPPETAPLPS